jgi:adenosylmethionine---8-amino-7-oxononanoate aminotransferase
VLESVLATRAHEIAAVVVEPLIQGAAGMLVHPRGYLRSVAALCRAHNVHLIADEVATGFGRTGTLFACEQESVSPDFLCLAKGLTGGTLPLAATLTTEAVYDAFTAPRAALRTFFHGHTYTGNPIACAAALANIALFGDHVLPHVNRIATAMAAQLARIAQHPAVQSTRQCGLMAGIVLGRSTEPFPSEMFVGSAVSERCRHYGVILRPLGDVVVWMPPLSSTDSDLQRLADATLAAIEDICDALLHHRD